MRAYLCENTTNRVFQLPTSLDAMKLLQQTLSFQMCLHTMMVSSDMVDLKWSNSSVAQLASSQLSSQCGMNLKCPVPSLTSFESWVPQMDSLVIMLKFKLAKLSKLSFACTVLTICKVNLIINIKVPLKGESKTSRRSVTTSWTAPVPHQNSGYYHSFIQSTSSIDYQQKVLIGLPPTKRHLVRNLIFLPSLHFIGGNQSITLPQTAIQILRKDLLELLVLQNTKVMQ